MWSLVIHSEDPKNTAAARTNHAAGLRSVVFFFYMSDGTSKHKTKQRDGGDDCWKKGLKKGGKREIFHLQRQLSHPSPALSTTTGEDVQLRRDGRVSASLHPKTPKVELVSSVGILINKIFGNIYYKILARRLLYFFPS